MIIIGNDHGGYELKKEIVKYFDELGIKYEDVGSYNKERTDCENYAKEVAVRVAEKNDNLGILICKTGNGMAITANKFKGIRCALCFDESAAKQAKEHINANIIAIPAEYIDSGKAIRMIRMWLGAEFLGERYAVRLEILKDIENENMK